MNSEKMQHRAIPVATLLGGVALALFIDSRFIMYTLLVISVVVSGYCGVLAFKNKAIEHRTLHRVACAFFAWTSFSAIFAARAFQLYSLPIIVLAGLIVSIALGFLWPEHVKPRELGWRVLAFFGCEWFAILLFAPANYLVLGALFMIAFVSTAILLDTHDRESRSRRDVVIHLAVTTIIAALFIFGFKWTL